VATNSIKPTKGTSLAECTHFEPLVAYPFTGFCSTLERKKEKLPNITESQTGYISPYYREL